MLNEDEKKGKRLNITLDSFLQNKMVFYFSIILSIFLILTLIFFYPVNNLIAVNGIKPFSYGFISFLLAISVFFVANYNFNKDVKNNKKCFAIFSIFAIISFALYKLLEFSDEMGVIFLGVSYLLSPVFILFSIIIVTIYFSRILKHKTREKRILIFIAAALIIAQTVTNPFNMLTATRNWEKSFYGDYINKAVQENNIKACEKLPLDHYDLVRDWGSFSQYSCIEDFVGAKKDAPIDTCFVLKDQALFEVCLSRLSPKALFSTERDICSKIKDGWRNFDCLVKEAIYFKDPESCKNTKYGTYYDEYIDNKSGYNNDCVEELWSRAGKDYLGSAERTRICDNLQMMTRGTPAFCDTLK